MSEISPKQFLDQMNWRYAVKKFDPAKTIPEDKWKVLEEALVLSPSSYGLQPWKFLVVKDKKLRHALRPHSWNQSQTEDCSHYVIFLRMNQVTEEHVDAYINRILEVRGGKREELDGYRKMMIGDVVRGARSRYVQEWANRQVYIALGNFMTSAAMLGIDTCPMEGIVPEKYDEILDLQNSGYSTVVACAAGYRHADDWLGSLKKVRFPAEKIVERR